MHDHRHLLKGISHGACVAHELTKPVVRPAKLVVIVSSIRQRGSSCFLVSTPPTQAARVKRAPRAATSHRAHGPGGTPPRPVRRQPGKLAAGRYEPGRGGS